MKIIGFKTILGPNVYHRLPVIIMRVDLGNYVDLASNEIPGFIEKLLTILPGLNEHTCSLGYRGGFCERLRRGTYLGHIIEHVALEMGGLAGQDIKFGKTRHSGEGNQYLIVTRFENEAGMKRALENAFEAVHAILQNRSCSMAEMIEDIRNEIENTKLGPSAEALWQAAKKRDIPVRRLGNESLLQLGYGKKIRRVQAAVTDRTNLISSDIVQNKAQTKELLKTYAIPVPDGRVVYSPQELIQAVQSFAGPYAVKPLDGHHGQGVNLHIQNEEEALKAFYIARKYSEAVIVEKMCFGKDYRILVVNGKLSAASERRPPTVFGNGQSTISQLIEELNKDPRRSEGHSGILTKIEVDAILLETLKRQGYSLEIVPPAGTPVILRANANLSSGGTARDVTDEMHPQTKALCERIARIVGLDICGVDVIHRDISEPPNEFFNIIEVNAGPGLRMHLSPSEGRPRPVADDIIEMMYPDGTTSRIPIISITGTNGKTTTARIAAKIFSDDKTCVGLTTSDGIWIGKDKVLSGDTTGPQSSQIVLSDPLVDVAVLEVARGGILRGGLAYDWSDVGIITNIRPDHVGQDGIEDLEDLVWIKSLVAERVKPGGTLVLNADDPESLRIRERSQVKKNELHIFLYSLKSSSSEIIEHVKAGGSACWLEKSWIYVRHKDLIQRLVSIRDLPFTVAGKAGFQISNALAAIAAAVALETPTNKIVTALKEFDSSHENLGRFNVYKVGEGYVVLDYGHNADAFAAIGELIQQFDGFIKTAILGLPGDRANSILREATQKVADYFNHIVLREDYDLRGRQAGEVLALMTEVIKGHERQPMITNIGDEVEAIEKTLSQIKKNEIVVIFYDSLPIVMKALRQFDPLPAQLPGEIRPVPVDSVPPTKGVPYAYGDYSKEIKESALK